MQFKKGKYHHYKGPYYEVFDIVFHSETQEKLVLYKPLYDNKNGEQHMWVRPYDMFFEEIEYLGKKVMRFAYVGN